ncbi:MAG: hypothetical protein U1E65_30810 [Myxococcota bacterium]
MVEASIAGLGTELPHRITTERFLELDDRARALQGQGVGTRDMVRQFALGSGIRFRHAVEPMWLPEAERAGLEDIFTPHNYVPPSYLRARRWMKEAPRLAVAAARKALADWGGPASDITHVVTTSTSGWSEPGISAALIHELGLSLDTQKQELNFNGCFAGMTCLRLGRDLMRAGDAKAVLVCAVETPSIQYDCTITDLSQLVASSLFADGAAAFVLAPEGKWTFEKTGMSLVPGSEQALRMSPDLETESATYRMFLDRAVPARLAEFFRRERGRELLNLIMQASGAEAPSLAVHPGGPSILEGVNRVFVERGWPSDALEHSMSTLYDTGNLGAAALMFVLARLLPEAETERVATFAFGPGVTVEWGLLRRNA